MVVIMDDLSEVSLIADKLLGVVEEISDSTTVKVLKLSLVVVWIALEVTVELIIEVEITGELVMLLLIDDIKIAGLETIVAVEATLTINSVVEMVLVNIPE